MIGYISRNGTDYTDRYVVDSVDEMELLPTTKENGKGDYESMSPAPIGSTAIVGNEGGEIKQYMLFSFGWKELPDNMKSISSKLKLLEDGSEDSY